MNTSLEAWDTQDTMQYQMMPKKKEGVASGPGKAQRSSLKITRTGRWEGVDWGTGRGKRAYGTFWERDPGKGKSLEI